eukprot:COSAG06_NODE_25430_length_637_cov_0.877323_1_plen_32_part_10
MAEDDEDDEVAPLVAKPEQHLAADGGGSDGGH